MVSFLPWKRPDLAIDLGTSNLRVIRRDEGIVFDEPSLCCFADIDNVSSFFAGGIAAQAMVDRTPPRLTIKRPLRRGVLQDIDAATELLRYAVSRIPGRRRRGGAHVVIGIPADATQAERGALRTAARDARLGAVRFVPEPFAAALGAGLPVHAPTGTMIVECGAGTTEVAVLSLGGICLTRSVREGGASLDRALMDHLHHEHKFLIGDLSAEWLKRDYVARRQASSTSEGSIQVKGRNLATGLPTFLDVALVELDRVAERHVSHITEVIRGVLHATPPELSQDIHAQGILLTGGSGVTPLIRDMIEKDTGLRVMVADAPDQCVANGLHRILTN